MGPEPPNLPVDVAMASGSLGRGEQAPVLPWQQEKAPSNQRPSGIKRESEREREGEEGKKSKYKRDKKRAGRCEWKKNEEDITDSHFLINKMHLRVDKFFLSV